MLAANEPNPRYTEANASLMVPKGMRAPFVLVTALFFLWGLPNNLNDVLIRQFMKSFQLNRFQAGLIQSAFYCGYFLLATPAALMMRRFGYKSGMIVGLSLLGAGTFLFWPAALIGAYWFFYLRCLSLQAVSRSLKRPRILSLHNQVSDRVKLFLL